jgi:hypothetical protein
MNYVEILRARRMIVGFGFIMAVTGVGTAIGVRLATTDVSVDMHHISYAVLDLTIASFAASAFATLLGSALALQNNGHLELAWSKPASRTRYAFGVIVADIVAILTAYAMVAAMALSIGALYHVDFGFSSHLLSVVPLCLLMPLSFYAISLASTASMGRRGEAVAGIVLGVAIYLRLLIQLPLPPVFHNIAYTVDLVSPAAYFGITVVPGGFATYAGPFGAVGDLVALLIFIALGVYIAIAQWRRLEIT